MAARTMAMNGLEERVEIMRADVAELRSTIPGCGFDAAVCNPPYGMPGKSMVNQAASLTTSRHQRENTLRDFFQAAHHLLKGKGKLYLVYPAAQMFSLMTALKEAHLEPKHFRLVYPDIRHPAKLVLMEAVKDARPLLQPMPPLIIQTESGDLTNELKSIYHMP